MCLRRSVRLHVYFAELSLCVVWTLARSEQLTAIAARFNFPSGSKRFSAGPDAFLGSMQLARDIGERSASWDGSADYSRALVHHIAQGH